MDPRIEARRWISVAPAFLGFLLLLSACSTSDPSPGSAPVSSTESPRASKPLNEEPRPRIVAFGDSLTSGYGLKQSESYPAQLQRLLDEQGYRYEVVSSGVSGETTAGGARRIAGALDGDVQIVIVALGGNDGLRGLPPAQLRENLETIVDAAKSNGAQVLLAGMEAPPMLGPAYTSEFRGVYTTVAEERGVALLPFLLDGVAGEDSLNQQDGIHPNAEGAKIVAATVLKALKPMLHK